MFLNLEDLEADYGEVRVSADQYICIPVMC